VRFEVAEGSALPFRDDEFDAVALPALSRREERMSSCVVVARVVGHEVPATWAGLVELVVIAGFGIEAAVRNGRKASWKAWGSSEKGKCPAPGISIRRAPGMPEARMRLATGGQIQS
jgi:hypothetical protein